MLEKKIGKKKKLPTGVRLIKWDVGSLWTLPKPLTLFEMF